MLRLPASDATRNSLPWRRTSATLGHPRSRLGQVAGDLRPDAEKMEGVRSTRFIVRGGADIERLMGKTPSRRDIGAQRDPREPAECL